MSFTTITKVRQLTNGRLTTSKISDDNLAEIILQATAKVNEEINTEVREEVVRYIDSWRKNCIDDGETTTFYVKNGVIKYLGDRNDDGEVTTSDIKVYKLDNEDNRTELTVTSIDIYDGSFTLSEAPGTDTRKLTVTYVYTFYDVTTPDKIIELLTGYLSCAWAHLSVEHGLSGSTKFGNISFSSPEVGKSATQYMGQYKALLNRVLIPLIKPRVGTSKYLI